MTTLPDLLDADGSLHFIVVEATPDDAAGILGVMLAATSDLGSVGIHLDIQAMTGNRVYYPAGLYSIGAPSDALVAALAAAWNQPGAAMVPTVPSWIWPPRARFKGGQIENAEAFTPSRLASTDTELSLQITGDDKKSDELVWFPLVIADGHIELRIANEERSMFMKFLTGAIRARHFPDEPS